MSNAPDISDIAFEAYRDIMAGYATLVRGTRYLDNMINCIDKILEQAKKCTFTNYKLCVSLVLEELEPCYINNLIPFFEYIGTQFESVMKSAEWITGGKGSSQKYSTRLAESLSKPVLQVMPVIDFIISLARVEGGIAEAEDIEFVNDLYPKIKRMLERHGVYVGKTRDLFYAKPFSTLMLYILDRLAVSKDMLQSNANMLRRQAYNMIKDVYRSISL